MDCAPGRVAAGCIKNNRVVGPQIGLRIRLVCRAARRTALLHNLMTVLLHRMEQIGFDEKKVTLRIARRRDQIDPEKRVPSYEMVHHAPALTCQFIRLVRHCLRYKIPWECALPLFQRRTAMYL